MKIDNTITGNYNAYAMQRTMRPAAIQPQAAAAISTEEKAFFINMYPEQKTEIQDYHFYQRSGKMSGVSVGSMFDRRM